MTLRDQKKEAMFGGARSTKASDQKRVEQGKVETKEYKEAIEQLEKDLNELRASYELFFIGSEKIEPTIPRDKIKAQIRRWSQEKLPNTALRFQVQQLKARFVSLENHWQRILRAREDGKYQRDLAKVKRRQQERLAVEKFKKPEPEKTPDLSRPLARSAEDLTDAKLRLLYDTYISARKRCGEPADLRYEDMAHTLRKQVPQLIKTTGAQAVEFKVVIRSGKAVLKAIPKI